MAKPPATTRFLSVEIAALVSDATVHVATTDQGQHEFVVEERGTLRLVKSSNESITATGHSLQVMFTAPDRPTLRVGESLRVGRLARNGISPLDLSELGEIEGLQIRRPRGR